MRRPRRVTPETAICEGLAMMLRLARDQVARGGGQGQMAVVGSRIYLSCAKEFVSDGLCVHETTNNTTWMIHEFYSDLDDMFSFGSSVFFSTWGFDGGELRSGVCVHARVLCKFKHYIFD